MAALTAPLAIRIFAVSLELDRRSAFLTLGPWELYARYCPVTASSWFCGGVDGGWEVDAGRFRVTLSKDPGVVAAQ